MTAYLLKGSFPLIFERGAPGRRGYRLPALDVPEEPVENLIPAAQLRSDPPALPEVSEPEVVRHYVGLSRRNYGVDVGFYPLGSCTMKYNPKVNEWAAALPGFARLHPYQPEETVQGALELIWRLERYLCEIAGLSRATLQPAAGAHGELLGLMIMRAYHEKNGDGDRRTEVIVPDSAHGTNPASAAMCGYRVVQVQTNERGGVDVEALKALVSDRTAGLMLTNPNTLGLFEEDIVEMARIVHEAGGLLYYDGANANAILGICRPGDMGFDIVHFNLHKTFSTPHGGGGPGAGPIAVRDDLVPFLPVPVVERDGDRYYLDYDRPESVGRIKGFLGNFGVLVRAYTYIRMHGPDGLRAVSEQAVLNANYLMRRLASLFDLPYDRHCKHEFVVSGRRYKRHGVRTLDIAKRLLDYGLHAPTIYFPLIVDEAIMIEPTETETKETLDEFVAIMEAIVKEIEEDPELVRTAPHEMPVRRLDEARAARQPDLCWCAPAAVAGPAAGAGGAAGGGDG
ncbi:MAG: aminomethyl-transferring glycine dehydrogenase subunit GcvPB [Limnochordales bacterium]|nr:aminomethyl-transferring glycine dehydrogenase subunit GcvPB [Limnochordales bacterium]